MLSRFTEYLEEKKVSEMKDKRKHTFYIKVLKHFMPVLESCSHHKKFTARITKKAVNDLYYTYFNDERISFHGHYEGCSLGYYEGRERHEFSIYFDGSVKHLISECEERLENFGRFLTEKKDFDKIEKFLTSVSSLCEGDKELENVIFHTNWRYV
tara:strand:- start:617 stop:1081 length:465 start_codon:yes stop_codon:yes gene_type:complete